ncbi:MAG: hypothetical protein ACTIA6_13175 [Pseudoclavibacter sp.]
MSELEEDAEVISLGDRVERLAENAVWPSYGDALADVVWHFDQYAPMRAESAWMITGTVTSIHAIYVRLAHVSGGEAEFGPEPGSLHLEARATTLGTRDPQRERAREELALHAHPPGVSGWYGPESLHPKAGDEELTGWLFTLEGERIRAAERWPI